MQCFKFHTHQIPTGCYCPKGPNRFPCHMYASLAAPSCDTVESVKGQGKNLLRVSLALPICHDCKYFVTIPGVKSGLKE
jgi:hypothetical protein